MRTYIDLFAGCGGLALGFHQAGWEGLLAIEKDPMAFQTFRTNFLDERASYRDFRNWPSWLDKAPHEIKELLDTPTLRDRLTALRGRVDVVAGGPPCQGFSVGGARNGADQRNTLVKQLLDVVDLVRPRAVLVENVEGMAKAFQSKPGVFEASAAEYVRRILETFGYQTTQMVVDASAFGVPQLRRRLAIVAARGFNGDLASAFDDCLRAARTRVISETGLPADRPVTAREAIEDLDGEKVVECPDSPGFLSGTYTGTPTATFGRLMRRDLLDSAVPDSHRFSNHGERILRIYRLAHATQTPGRLPREFLLGLGTKKDKKVLVDPSRPVSTITTHPDEFIHYARPRNVSVREMARLQSFPDDFVFRGRYTINGPRRRFDVARCSQVGNAVPPLLARGIGFALDSLLGQSLPAAQPEFAGVT